MSSYERPVQLTEHLEKVRQETVKKWLAQRKALKEGAGRRPYNATHLSQSQKLSQLGAIRDNPQAWAEIIDRVGRVKESGAILLPKEFVAETKALYAELRGGTL